MVTRSKVGIFQPKIYAFSIVPTSIEPQSYKEAMKHEVWLDAMKKEMEALRKNKMWVLVLADASQWTIGCKRIFKVKLKSYSLLERCKAKLVAKGFHQQSSIDYAEAFSPVVNSTTIQLILALALHFS